MLNNSYSKIVHFMRYVEKSCIVGQATDDYTAHAHCMLAEATHTHTHTHTRTQYVILIAFALQV